MISEDVNEKKNVCTIFPNIHSSAHAPQEAKPIFPPLSFKLHPFSHSPKVLS